MEYNKVHCTEYNIIYGSESMKYYKIYGTESIEFSRDIMMYNHYNVDVPHYYVDVNFTLCVESSSLFQGKSLMGITATGDLFLHVFLIPTGYFYLRYSLQFIYYFIIKMFVFF